MIQSNVYSYPTESLHLRQDYEETFPHNYFSVEKKNSLIQKKF